MAATLDTLNGQWKNDKSAFGFRMLQRMGWSEEKGLGKNESGITNNIKVEKRETGLGLGVEQSTDSAGLKGWNSTLSSFNDVLSVLKENYGDKSSSKKKKDKKEKKVEKISIGLKYKKVSHAKDLKNKSNEDLKAIFGIAATIREDNGERAQESSNEKAAKKKRKSKSREKNNEEEQENENEDI